MVVLAVGLDKLCTQGYMMYTGQVCGVLEALGRSFRHLGAVLDVSWGLLEPLWWHLIRSWSCLGRVLELLGPLGAIVVAS